MSPVESRVKKFSLYLRVVYVLQLVPMSIIISLGLFSSILKLSFFKVDWFEILTFDTLLFFSINISIILIGKQILKRKKLFFIVLLLLLFSLFKKLILITVIIKKAYYPFPLIGNFIGIFIDLIFIFYLLWFIIKREI